LHITGELQTASRITTMTNASGEYSKKTSKYAWVKNSINIRVHEKTLALVKQTCPKGFSYNDFVYALVSRAGQEIHDEEIRKLEKFTKGDSKFET